MDNGGTANGGEDTSTAQSFTITITPVNDAPVPQDFSGTTLEDNALHGQLVATDVDGDALTFSRFGTGPNRGTLALNADGSFVYTPNADFFGSDAFAFRVSDGKVTTGVFVARITVQGVNDDPVAVDDLYEILPAPEQGLILERWVSYDFLVDHPLLEASVRPIARRAGRAAWVELTLNDRRLTRVPLDHPRLLRHRLEPPYRRAAPNVIRLTYGYERVGRRPGADIGVTGVRSPVDVVVASGLAFDTTEIDLPADQPTQITLDNRDPAVVHNISIFPNEDSLDAPMFDGADVTGPDQASYDVPAFQAGTYYFHCDTHPNMSGSVVVAAGEGGGDGGGEPPPTGATGAPGEVAATGPSG